MPNSSILSENRFPVSLAWDGQTASVGALIDSGADDNLIDSEFAMQSGITIVPLPAPLSVQALNGNHLGKITHQTIPLSLSLFRETMKNLFVSEFYMRHLLPLCWAVRGSPNTTRTSRGLRGKLKPGVFIVLTIVCVLPRLRLATPNNRRYLPISPLYPRLTMI